MAINVCTLMPLRTTVNYQYRYGSNMKSSINKLYQEGKILRFYREVSDLLLYRDPGHDLETRSQIMVL